MVAVIQVMMTMTMDFLVILHLISLFVSLSQLDAHRYVYSNGVSVSDDGVQIVQQLKVTSTKKAVDTEMIGSDVVLDGIKSYTNMQLMGGDVTVTRIGIRGKIHYKLVQST